VLTQLAGTSACVSETGSSGACADGVALDGIRSLALSPDGKFVYGAALNSDSVVAFSRNLGTGALTQLASTGACVSETGTSGACVDGVALDGATSVAVSADGKHVDAVSTLSDAVVAMSRNTSTVVLTQLAGTDGCVSNTGTAGPASTGTPWTSRATSRSAPTAAACPAP
jgi:hypothetical protein